MTGKQTLLRLTKTFQRLVTGLLLIKHGGPCPRGGGVLTMYILTKCSRRMSDNLLRYIFFLAIKVFVKVEEAVVETVEEKYVPHIQPPIQPLSWAEVCNDC